MPRPKSNKKVAVVTAKKTGATLDVMMNPNTLKFYVEFQGEIFEAGVAQEVIDWAQNRVDNENKIAWEQVIEVRINRIGRENYHEYGHISYQVHRFWIGRTSTGKLMRAEWGSEVARPNDNIFVTPERAAWEKNATVEDRLLRQSTLWEPAYLSDKPAETFVLPYFLDRPRGYGSEEPMLYLSYSLHLWASLAQLGAGINSLTKKIDVAIRQPEAAEALESLSNLVAISVGSVEGSSYYQRTELLRLYDTLSTYYEADKRVELKVDYDYSEEEMDQIGVVVELVMRTSGTGLIAVTVYDPDQDPHTPPVDTVLDWMTPAEGVEKMRAELDAFAEKDPTFPG